MYFSTLIYIVEVQFVKLFEIIYICLHNKI
jgi:hypothetical protein